MSDRSNSPIAVVISDVHYDLSTLELADAAMNQAIDVANNLDVPLIVAGDFTTHKAHMRSEVVRRTIETVKRCKIVPIFIVGNHDKDNERSEGHALEYLRPYVTIIDKPTVNLIPHWTFIPYQSDVDSLKKYLKAMKRSRHQRIIMHQGVNGSESGEYMQDRTALEKEDLAGLTVISGHYHKGQHFDLPDGGTFTYVGNPYTLNFGEANDSSKGFIVLMKDGSFERHYTLLRAHKIFEFELSQIPNVGIGPLPVREKDMIWIKITGSRDLLAHIIKDQVKKDCGFVQDFRLELIPTDITTDVMQEEVQKIAPKQLFDKLIDRASGLSDAQRIRIKALWKDLI